MDAIKQLTELDYGTLIIGISVIAVVFKGVYEFGSWFVGFLGIETRRQRQKREEHELLITTVQNLNNLQAKQESDMEQSIKHDKLIKQDLAHLTNMFVQMEIDNIRWNILKFCTDLSNGKKAQRESYDYIFKQYDKYEKMLEENGLTNGLVEQSIAYIREQYYQNLKSK